MEKQKQSTKTLPYCSESRSGSANTNCNGCKQKDSNGAVMQTASLKAVKQILPVILSVIILKHRWVLQKILIPCRVSFLVIAKEAKKVNENTLLQRSNIYHLFTG